MKLLLVIIISSLSPSYTVSSHSILDPLDSELYSICQCCPEDESKCDEGSTLIDRCMLRCLKMHNVRDIMMHTCMDIKQVLRLLKGEIKNLFPKGSQTETTSEPAATTFCDDVTTQKPDKTSPELVTEATADKHTTATPVATTTSVPDVTTTVGLEPTTDNPVTSTSEVPDTKTDSCDTSTPKPDTTTSAQPYLVI